MKISHRAGFTLVETIISLTIGLSLLMLVLKFSGQVRTNIVKGDADLQNLKEARLALNSLRRDFSLAMPYFDKGDKRSVWQEIRNDPLIYVQQYNKSEASRPMIVASEHEVHFYKYEDGDLINVSYVFDSVGKCLNRTTSKGNRSFTGIKNVRFLLFYHKLNTEIPMLWVHLTLEHKEAGNVRDLELASTMVSSVVSLELDNLSWNRQY